MSGTAEAARWKLEVLGGARLSGPTGAPRLERKTAAVLAYLALEGPTAKYQLAGLLWPDSPETTARNNMRQLLRRLRMATGAELVAGEVHISLSEAASADAAGLRAHVLAGRHAQVLELQGELLAGLDFDDCPELDAWLQRTREQLLASRLHAVNTEADRLEQRGELARAVELATRSLALEPCSEEAWRRLMRLHYLAGDRAAALGAFEQCRLMLQRELDTVPMPETRELARQIERGWKRAAWSAAGPSGCLLPARCARSSSSGSRGSRPRRSSWRGWRRWRTTRSGWSWPARCWRCLPCPWKRRSWSWSPRWC